MCFVVSHSTKVFTETTYTTIVNTFSATCYSSQAPSGNTAAFKLLVQNTDLSAFMYYLQYQNVLLLLF